MPRWLPSWLCCALVLCAGVEAWTAAPPRDDRQTLQARGLGQRLFLEHCESCHGRTGRGDGPRAKDLATAPPDLTRLSARNGWRYPADSVTRVIEGGHAPDGSRVMPNWGDVFRAQPLTFDGADARAKIDGLVLYLEFVQARPPRW